MERLYWTEPEIFEAEVEVKSVDGNRVTIEPVLFHPDEGGQPADKGNIGEAEVLKVEIRNGEVLHTLDKCISEGKHPARLDKPHRIHTASQHTAQHIISGIAESQFKLNTVGVHIGMERCTVDFDKAVDWKTLQVIEQQAMEVVGQNLTVETVFNDADVRVRSDLKEIESEVIRVVKIGEIDKSACCGAHLKSTGRIGIIRIFDSEKKKSGTRVYFLAGRKALEFSQLETSVMQELRKSVRCATADLPEIIQKNIEQSRKLNKEVNRLWTNQLPELVKTADIIEYESSEIGIQVVEVPARLTTKLAAMIAEEIGAGIVVNVKNISIYSETLDANELFEKIQVVAGGRGGGSAKAVNGVLEKVLAVEEIKAVLGDMS